MTVLHDAWRTLVPERDGRQRLSPARSLLLKHVHVVVRSAGNVEMLAVRRPGNSHVSVGHLQSLALDPASGQWVVLLTNAVHFGRDYTEVKALRRDVHQAIISFFRATPP